MRALLWRLRFFRGLLGIGNDWEGYVDFLEVQDKDGKTVFVWRVPR